MAYSVSLFAQVLENPNLGDERRARVIYWRREGVQAMREYIEQRDGGYWISGSRVSLDSVVYAFLRGASPESIAQSFPVLTLEQVYGAITFYLSHRDEIDVYLAQGEADFEEMRKKAREAYPLLYRKFEAAKNKMLAD